MSVWNVFRMELYKNIHDRVNLIVMLVFMAINILGGLNVMNAAHGMGTMMALLFSFSVLGSTVFLFIYPYQMARTDYKNKVMSLLIASGVSRVQYYFVKIGATLLFSFISLVLLVILPLFIVLMANDMSFVLDILGVAFSIEFAHIALIFIAWLSFFFILMTSVIISKGRAYTIFVFFGLSIAATQFGVMFYRIFNIGYQINYTLMFIQYVTTMAIMGVIGIVVLSKQNL